MTCQSSLSSFVPLQAARAAGEPPGPGFGSRTAMSRGRGVRPGAPSDARGRQLPPEHVPLLQLHFFGSKTMRNSKKSSPLIEMCL